MNKKIYPLSTVDVAYALIMLICSVSFIVFLMIAASFFWNDLVSIFPQLKIFNDVFFPLFIALGFRLVARGIAENLSEKVKNVPTDIR